MDAIDLLTMIKDARALGLSITTNGDKLNVTGPKTAEASALVQQLAQHKAAVLELLRTPLQPADISPITFVATDPAALPPMRNHTGKPALPAELWVDFAMLGEALSAQRQLSAQHATVCGLDSATGRYYVRGYGWQC